MTLKAYTREELTPGCYIFKGSRLERIVTKDKSWYEVLPDQTDVIKILKINDKYFLFISLITNGGAFIYHWDECQGKTDYRKIFHDGVFYAIPTE